MHVRHFMTPDPAACEATDSIEDVSLLMRERGVGFVVVLDGGKVAGIVTDRQIVTGCVALGLAPASTPVGDVMTTHPATVTLDDTIFSVIDTFRSAGVVRRVPVVNEDDELVGVVSLSDVAVVARDLVDAIMLEETRHALREVKGPSGGKNVRKEIRSGGAVDFPRKEFQPVTKSSVEWTRRG